MSSESFFILAWFSVFVFLTSCLRVTPGMKLLVLLVSAFCLFSWIINSFFAISCNLIEFIFVVDSFLTMKLQLRALFLRPSLGSLNILSILSKQLMTSSTKLYEFKFNLNFVYGILKYLQIWIFYDIFYDVWAVSVFFRVYVLF